MRAQAVNFRGGSHQDFLVFFACLLQQNFGAMHVGDDGVHGTVDDEPDADCRGQMKHDIAKIDQLGNGGAVVNAADFVVKTRIRLVVQEIFDAAGG